MELFDLLHHVVVVGQCLVAPARPNFSIILRRSVRKTRLTSDKIGWPRSAITSVSINQVLNGSPALQKLLFPRTDPILHHPSGTDRLLPKPTPVLLVALLPQTAHVLHPPRRPADAGAWPALGPPRCYRCARATGKRESRRPAEAIDRWPRPRWRRQFARPWGPRPDRADRADSTPAAVSSRSMCVNAAITTGR